MTARFDAIGLVVADMGRSLAFYRMLGLEIAADADGEPHVEAALPGGGGMLYPDWTPPSGSPGIGLAFACDDVADVDRVYAELTAAGHHGHREPWDAFWGQRYASVRDPDGNSVDLFAPLETAGS